MNAPRPRVNRRDLLRLRRAGASLGETAAPAGRVPSAEASTGDLLRASRPAMGSYFEVRLGATVPGAAELAGRVLDLVDELEGQLTVYRDDSELSLVNQTAHLAPVALEPRLFDLLSRAVRLSEETGGAYDVAAGALSSVWGFVRGPKRVPDPECLAEARACTGSGHAALDPDRQTVAFDRAGVTLNLGSIGKGYAIDRAAEVVRDYWFPTGALIHGGRSSLYALGSPPGRFAGRWTVALRNPFAPEKPLGLLHLRNRGMGTSGIDFQRFEAGGRVYGHILDPRTGEPAEGPASVTVLAPTAAEADALSTAFYLLGPEGASNYVRRHPEVAAIFVEEGPADGSPRIRTVGDLGADFERDTG